MFISDTTTDDDTTNATHNNDMMIEVVVPHHHNHHHAHMSHSSGGPKKRAETWGQDETRSLISLRRDMDALFNTSKSNKHLWEQISLKMRDRGFERSATMCTDKWRNLLKEFKKVKQQNCSSNNGNRRSSGNGGGNNCSSNSNNVIGGKMSYYKEIEEILNERCRSTSSRQLDDGSGGGGNGNVNGNGNGNGNGGGGGGIHSSKVDTTFLNFSDKGIDDASIPFGPMEANGRPILNLETRLDHEGHPLAISTADTVAGGGVPTFWRETPGNGDDHSFDGRVIVVKWGDYTRRIGVDGTADAIKDVIRSAFGLRTKRAFWLEDDDQVVRSLDRDMPLGTYTLHLDEGMTIKLCHYEESDHIPYPGQTISHTEEKTFYTEEDFREFMNRRGWSSLRELSVYRNIDNLDDLRPDALYRGVT